MAHVPSAADLAAVHNLIGLISDPVRAKAHLEEIAKYAPLAEQAKADRAAANRALADARTQSETNAVDAARLKSVIDARAAELDAKEARLAEMAQAMGPREQQLAERERRVANAENTISERDERSRMREEAVAASEQALAAKAKRLAEAIQ